MSAITSTVKRKRKTKYNWKSNTKKENVTILVLNKKHKETLKKKQGLI